MSQEIKEMIENIPAEVRWNIATQAGTATAVALDAAIQEAVGPETRKEILTKIYAGSAPGVKQIIEALGLPTDNAAAALKAVTCANTIMFGNEIQIEVTEASPQKAAAKVTGCAFPLRMKELGVKMDCLPVCTAYQEAAYKAVNPKLKINMGDKCVNEGDPSSSEFVVEMQE
jgi:hypothetical protein